MITNRHLLDIVDRLRLLPRQQSHLSQHEWVGKALTVAIEAANEIERLHGGLARNATEIWTAIEADLSDRGCFNGIDDEVMKEIAETQISLIERHTQRITSPEPQAPR